MRPVRTINVRTELEPLWLSGNNDEKINENKKKIPGSAWASLKKEMCATNQSEKDYYVFIIPRS
jgi:hypothetical protein